MHDLLDGLARANDDPRREAVSLHRLTGGFQGLAKSIPIVRPLSNTEQSRFGAATPRERSA
jgi:hypothetical protein